MSTLEIRAEKNDSTIDGLVYHFSRNRIDYTLFRKEDCIDIYKTNRQQCNTSCDRFWNGVNNRGQKMAKFLKQVIEMIEAN